MTRGKGEQPALNTQPSSTKDEDEKGNNSKPQVCDCCRIRRIKCDGLKPCWRCVTSDLECTFSAVRRRRGPKGNQSSVLLWLRQSKGMGKKPYSNNEQHSNATNNTNATSNSNAFSWSYFPDGVLKILLEAYFDYMNPIVPIMDRAQTLEYLDVQEPPSAQIYMLIITLAAVPLKRVTNISQEYQNPEFRQQLLAEAMRVKGSPEIIKNPSLISIKTSFFLYLNFCATEEYDIAWYYLQEAITLSRILGIDQETFYHRNNLTHKEELDARLVFWGLFVSERGFSIHERRPVVLNRSIELPRPEIVKEPLHLEFISLIQLMGSVDDNFYPVWMNPTSLSQEGGSNNTTSNENKYNSSNNSKELVFARMQDQVLSVLSSAPVFHSPIQKSNILITQPWLLLLLWRLNHQWSTSPSDTYSSQSTTSIDSQQFPLYVAKLAHQVANSVSLQDLMVHGPGMRKKLFDITHTLAETMILRPQILYDAGNNLDQRGLLHSLTSVVKAISVDCINEFKLLEPKVSEAMQFFQTANQIPLWQATSSHQIEPQENGNHNIIEETEEKTNYEGINNNDSSKSKIPSLESSQPETITSTASSPLIADSEVNELFSSFYDQSQAQFM